MLSISALHIKTTQITSLLNIDCNCDLHILWTKLPARTPCRGRGIHGRARHSAAPPVRPPASSAPRDRDGLPESPADRPGARPARHRRAAGRRERGNPQPREVERQAAANGAVVHRQLEFVVAGLVVSGRCLADIPHIPSKFVEFVPLSHRQGNCIPYAARNNFLSGLKVRDEGAGTC